MLARRALLTSTTAILALSLATPAAAQSYEPIPMVATFSILGDMVKRIGGEHVDVTTLVGPDGDTHVYQPTPAAARAISEARILVVNGLGFEGWLNRLIDASDFRGIRVLATDGIEPIVFGDEHDHGDRHKVHAEEDGHDHDRGDLAEAGDDHDRGKHAGVATHDHEDDHEEEAYAESDHHHHGAFDPHAWQSLGNAVAYVDNITDALAKADPVNATDYYRNRAAYVTEIETLDAEIRNIVARVPADRRTIVTSHDAFQYFGRDYGLEFVAPQGLSTESEASAKDIVRLIRQIRELGIRAVFVENIADPRLLERIADETGAAIGGTLYPGALSGPDGPAPTYLDMMWHNAMTLAQALTS